MQGDLQGRGQEREEAESLDARGRDREVAAEGREGLAQAEKRVESEVDCSETTGPHTDLTYVLTDSSALLLDDVTNGLDLTIKSQSRCAKKVVTGLAKACSELLSADATHIQSATKTRDRAKLDASRAEAGQKFLSTYASATSGGCPTGATGEGLLEELEAAVAAAKDVATISKSVDDEEFTEIVPRASSSTRAGPSNRRARMATSGRSG